MEDLKRCPFCGGDADYVQREVRKTGLPFVFVQCVECNAQTKAFFTDNINGDYGNQELADILKRRAANSWNRRSDER